MGKILEEKYEQISKKILDNYSFDNCICVNCQSSIITASELENKCKENNVECINTVGKKYRFIDMSIWTSPTSDIYAFEPMFDVNELYILFSALTLTKIIDGKTRLVKHDDCISIEISKKSNIKLSDVLNLDLLPGDIIIFSNEHVKTSAGTKDGYSLVLGKKQSDKCKDKVLILDTSLFNPNVNMAEKAFKHLKDQCCFVLDKSLMQIDSVFKKIILLNDGNYSGNIAELVHKYFWQTIE